MKTYDELTFTDDFLFSRIMQNKEICKELVELLLDIKVGKIEYLQSQSTINEDFLGHGVRFDVYLKDSDRVFDIEMQTFNTGNLIKRARYYQAMIDIDDLKKSNDYNELKESYIIFICTFDPFGKGLSKYTIEQIVKELPDYKIDDKTHKIFYNSSSYSKSSNQNIQSFLKYLETKEPSSSFTTRLEKAVFEAKGHEQWRARYMTLYMKLQESRKEGISIGKNEGMHTKAIETAKNLIKLNVLSYEQIAQSTGLTLQQIQELTN